MSFTAHMRYGRRAASALPFQRMGQVESRSDAARRSMESRPVPALIMTGPLREGGGVWEVPTDRVVADMHRVRGRFVCMRNAWNATAADEAGARGAWQTFSDGFELWWTANADRANEDPAPRQIAWRQALDYDRDLDSYQETLGRILGGDVDCPWSSSRGRTVSDVIRDAGAALADAATRPAEEAASVVKFIAVAAVASALAYAMWAIRH